MGKPMLDPSEFRARLRDAFEERNWSPSLRMVDFVALLEFVEVELGEWLKEQTDKEPHD